MLSKLVVISSIEAALKQCIAYTILENPFCLCCDGCCSLCERLGVVPSLLTVNGLILF